MPAEINDSQLIALDLFLGDVQEALQGSKPNSDSDTLLGASILKRIFRIRSEMYNLPEFPHQQRKKVHDDYERSKDQRREKRRLAGIGHTD